jgi:Uma2 family endonuclease
MGYQCFPASPEKIRRPDVSFIAKERLSKDLLAHGYIYIAPDLAVEVLSPNDLAYEVDQKVDEYLSAGVRLIWIVNPEKRTVTIHRPSGTVTKLNDQDVVDGEDVLPGFRCPVHEFFPDDATLTALGLK